MAAYLFRQTAILLATLFIASLLIFSMVRLVPGDPVIAAIGEENYSPELYAATERRLGLDQPFAQQLVDYLKRMVTLDFGVSFHSGQSVLGTIIDQLPYTFVLAILSFLLSILIGFPAGIIAALYRNSWLDQLVMVSALSALCVPSFFLGLLSIFFFAGRLGWLPSFGSGDIGDPVSVFHHAILPSLVLGSSAAGLLARLVRSSILEVLSQDYVRTARAKGLPERIVILRHAMPNSMIPVVTVLGLELAQLLTGTVVIESLFSRLGVGKTLVDAIQFRDYPQIQGTLLVFVAFVLLANTLTDLAYTVLDPRIKIE